MYRRATSRTLDQEIDELLVHRGGPGGTSGADDDADGVDAGKCCKAVAQVGVPSRGLAAGGSPPLHDPT